jgi:hypothetical protein
MTRPRRTSRFAPRVIKRRQFLDLRAYLALPGFQ